MKPIYLIITMILSVAILTGCSANTPIACTMEAKICPDGSSVGRTGPNCEFPTCPQPTGKLQAIDCTERNQICTEEYMPVCGQVQVECIKAPCPPIKQTFDNKCVACANSLTISYTQGACADDPSKLI